MKVFNWIAWISLCIGIVSIVLGAISLLFDLKIIANHAVNYFHFANSFFLLTIALFIFIHKCDCKKD